MKSETAFSMIPLPQRQAKPRDRGITMMIDWGLPIGLQTEVVETAGHYIDMAKIAGPIAGLMPKQVVEEKLSIFRAAEISTSQGGLFAELAFKQGNIEHFFGEVRSLGFSAVEISDNLLDWSLQEKQKTIRCAVEDFGLKVLGEVGKKEGAMNDNEVLADLDACFEAGASVVFLEAYELFAGDEIRDELIGKIAKQYPGERIIYELPVVILPGITREFKHKVAAWLVREFGTEVNLANVEWDELWLLEAVRRGAAGETSHPQGAYQLAGFKPEG
ncbi:MAG: phosphosulfolactate synthase [Rhodospirillales bacterium]|jgi:phosphosulfolactate synthase|nr:phosphosulfolactate synthase [Alphaproteobacteria bacterium]MDP6926474.1 phosphosulfolactate synthase [Rhodospirillales bacterium]